MVAGGPEGGRSGVLEAPSAVYRGFQGHSPRKQKVWFKKKKFIETVPLAYTLSNFLLLMMSFTSFYSNLLYEHRMISLNPLSILSTKDTDNMLYLYNTLHISKYFHTYHLI